MMVMLLQWLGVLFIALVRAITEQEAGVEFLLPTPSNNDTSTNTELFMEYAAKACQKYSERSDSCVRALMQKYDYSSEVQFAKLLAEQTLLLQSMINNHHKLVELAQRFPPAYADEASMVEDMLPAISSLKGKPAEASPPLAAIHKQTPSSKNKGDPTYFITLTCNPNWPELQQFLNGRPYTDRPDIVERIFQQKRDLFLEAILTFEVLGKVAAYCWTEEWQKRFLPHIHLLLTLAEAFRPRTPEEIDRVITCELADKETHPRLFELQATCMMHSCGTPEKPLACSTSGTCKYGYPHNFSDSTQLNKGGYPKYKRRDQGRSFTGARGREFTNRDLLPTNPWLILFVAAHVFVELCSGFNSIKYVNKYINKGPDLASLGLQEEEKEGSSRNEIKQFISTRYICSPEAFNRLSEFATHGLSHHVKVLKIHLPGKQTVHFQAGNESEAVAKAESHRTELEAFFLLCSERRTTQESGGEVVPSEPLRYPQVVQHFTFDKNDDGGRWKRRVRHPSKPVLARISPVSIRTGGDLFYLRLLLLHVQEPTSFVDLLTYDSSLHNTFQDACIALGILQSDTIWDETMNEASQVASPSSLRSLFAILCCHNQLSDSKKLFDSYCEKMTEDFVHQGHPSDQARNLALLDIEEDVLDMDFTMEKIGLHVPVHVDPSEVELNHQWGQIRQAMARTFSGQFKMENLRPQQHAIADRVLGLAQQVKDGERSTPKIMYVKGKGGTGKTVLMNTVIWGAMQRTAEPLNVASCAFSGIASTLLIGGTTLHKTFRLPLEEGQPPRVAPNSKQGQFLRSVHLFLFDEASMIPLWMWNAINDLLKDISKNYPEEELPPFGGKAVMLTGDFSQILPIIQHGSRAQAKAAKVYFQSVQEFPAPQWESRWRFSEEAVKSKMPHPYKSFLIYTHQPVIDNYVSAEIIRRGMWDMEKTLMVLRVMEQLGPQGQIFVDLGSNLGWFALAVAAQGHRAVAVEPWGRNLRKLRAGVSLNGLAGLVRVVGVAASDAHRDGVCIGSGDDENAANGHLQMDANMEDEGGGGGGGGACADEDSVPTAPLDALLRGAGGQGGESFPPVAAMKIDLEHHEVEAVRGARELFLDPEARPCVVYAETFVDVIAASHPEEHSQSEYHVFFEIMVKEYGYSTYLENGAFLDHNILSSKENVIWKVETEFVFKRNPPDPRCVVLD